MNQGRERAKVTGVFFWVLLGSLLMNMYLLGRCV